MARYGIQMAQLNGSAVVGITSAVDSLQRQIASEGTDGLPQENYHYGQRTAPTVEISGLAIGSYLDLLTGSNDLPLLALNGSTGLVVWSALASTSGPGYAGGSTARKTTALSGQIFLAGLSWSAGGDVEATLRCLAYGATGETSPLVRATTTLPTQTANEERWTVGDVSVAGADLVSVDSIEITCDPMLEHEYDSGLPHPVGLVGAGARGPVQIRCRITTGNLAAADSDGSGTVTITLRKRAAGGTLVASGTENIALTFNAQWLVVDGDNRQHGTPASRVIEVMPIYDSPTYPFAWSHTVVP